MKTKNLNLLILLVVLTSFAMQSCKKENALKGGDFKKSSKAPIDYASLPEVHLTGVYTGTRVLGPDTLYLLDGIVYFSGSNANLYIKAGTHVVSGNPRTYSGRQIKGVLVITKNAQIFADGNKSGLSENSYNPDSTIVFGPHPDNVTPQPGDFGGVILLGNAPTNQPTYTYVEGIPFAAQADVTYGGANYTDNSGILRYVRIENAGFMLTTENAINGLTLAGVGSGTTLSHIQVSYSLDDSFEFFGGNVNADHLVALAGVDDDFDFNFGYTGTIQYAIALKNREGNHSISSGMSDANGIESDNNLSSDTTSTFLTRPTLSNFTILGYSNGGIGYESDELENGVHIRRKSGVKLQNSIVAGFNNGIRFENIKQAGSTTQFNLVHGFISSYLPGGLPAVFTNNQAFTGWLSPDFLGLAGGESSFYANGSYDPGYLTPAEPPVTNGGIGGSYCGAIDPTGVLWTDNWTRFNF